MAGGNGRARFYVDSDDCIGCGLCEERAPNNVEVPFDEAVVRVFRQPKTDAEEISCFEAAEFCPTGGLYAEVSEESNP